MGESGREDRHLVASLQSESIVPFSADRFLDGRFSLMVSTLSFSQIKISGFKMGVSS